MTMPARPSLPSSLAGVRVLDLGTMIAGPMVATLLGDFGADVIKLELPGQGDTLRSVGAAVDGVNLAWLVTGRNKRGITLDLRRPEGRELLLRLLPMIDIAVENFRPGTLDRWGLDEPTLRSTNPGLVLVRVSGYGQDGPYASRPGFDGVAQAFSGLTYMTGYPESPPSRCGAPVADFSTAYNGAFAAMAALYHRDAHGGPGQTIDLALFETVFSMTRELVAQYELTGEVRERQGNSNPQSAPAGCFQTSDGVWLMVSGSNDNTWRRLAEAIERPDLLADERFTTNNGRTAHAAKLNALLAGWIGGRTAGAALSALESAGVPATRIYSVAEIAADEHYAARQALVTVEHPTLGRFRIPGIPARMSATPGRLRSLGPALGEHNDEVYQELLGLTTEELDRLRTDRVL